MPPSLISLVATGLLDRAKGAEAKRVVVAPDRVNRPRRMRRQKVLHRLVTVVLGLAAAAHILHEFHAARARDHLAQALLASLGDRRPRQAADADHLLCALRDQIFGDVRAGGDVIRTDEGDVRRVRVLRLEARITIDDHDRHMGAVGELDESRRACRGLRRHDERLHAGTRATTARR